MRVYLLKDVESVGLAGQMLNVSEGYATNFLVPKKLAVVVTEQNEAFYKLKVKKVDVDKKVLSSKIAMLAEKINGMHVSIKKRVHDDGKLYGAVGAEEIVDLLKDKGISINKKQVELDKTVKSIGDHKVIIRLTSKLKPELILKVVAQ